ncbi:uncharacterized protein LOC102802599 [Saccoglossus kowalevskii]|uniref:Cell cycle checkpoint protein RAD17-like n=1 Tax=Saccoglossus kowalevskii TaxID=10224 RepID=A0ABM0MQT8_SACKO|nr:PREDICTED: cell cycle checkpoint protein RAD17-like [Saccoglossus kowalevskii]
MSFNRKTSKSGQATLLTLWSDNGDSIDGEDFKDSEQSQPVSNKRAQWISSSFDDFGQNSGEKKSSFSTANKGGKKRPRDTQANKSTVKTSQKPRKIEIETEIWADVHKPKLQADLAVHKKKIAEVELWLQQHISHTAHIVSIDIVS